MSDERLNFLENKCLVLTQRLRNNDDAMSYALAISLMSIVFFITAVLHYIIFGFSSTIISFIVIAIILLVLYKFRIKHVLDINKQHSSKLEANRNYKHKHVCDLNEFLKSASHVKITRIKMVRLIYVIVFPMFLILLFELVNGQNGKVSFSWLIFMAIIMSVPVWYFYFGTQLSDLVLIEKTTEDIKSDLNELETVVKQS